MHGTFLVIFQVFHDFQSLWELCTYVLHFRWGQFSIVAGDHDLSSNEGTEQTIDVDNVIMVRAII